VSADPSSARRLSPLSGALLGMLVQGPGYGYDLANRLERQLGPSWNINRRTMYRMLGSLEKQRLVSSDRSNQSNPDRIMYSATPTAEATLTEWMATVAPLEPVRTELQAKMVVARREDLPGLLDALNEYERQLFELQQAIEVDLPPQRSLRAGMMYLVRETALGHIAAELQGVDRARKMILDFIET
jgi:DNA-binding PadR family transcriptional regulator